MTVESYFSNLVMVMDRWVIIVSFLTVSYLVVNFRLFYRKYIALSYILVLTLFIFWSVRAIMTTAPRTPHPLVWAFSFLLDVAVIGYAASIIYHYEKSRDFGYVRQLLGLYQDTGDVITYGGPEMEGVEPGKSYLVLERGHAYELDLFDTLTDKLPGLCFTRKHPDKLTIDVDGKDVTVYWIADASPDTSHNTIEPFRQGEMTETIQDFVNTHENPVILLDGLEYLFYKNPAEAIINMIQHLSDALAHRQDVTLIYSLEEEAITEQQFSLLKEEVDEVRTTDDEGNVEKRVY